MINQITLAVLDKAESKFIGTAFWFSKKYIMTCAHVVAAALGYDRMRAQDPEVPEGTIKLKGYDGQVLACRVHYWEPTGNSAGDIALLMPEDPRISNTTNVTLLGRDDLRGIPFEIFGFPTVNGERCAGTFLGPLGGFWEQMDGQTAQAVRGGYSGAPVCMSQSSVVVGMAVAATASVNRTSFMLSARAFKSAADFASISIQKIPSQVQIKQVVIDNVPDGGVIHQGWLDIDLMDEFARAYPDMQSADRILKLARQSVRIVVGEGADAYIINPLADPVWRNPLFWWQEIIQMAFTKGPKMTAALLNQLPANLVSPQAELVRSKLMLRLLEGRGSSYP